MRTSGECIPYEVHARRECINAGLLRASVEDTNFGVGDTAIEAGLGVRLVLNLPVALVRSCTFGTSSEQCSPPPNMSHGTESKRARGESHVDPSWRADVFLMHCGGPKRVT